MQDDKPKHVAFAAFQSELEAKLGTDTEMIMCVMSSYEDMIKWKDNYSKNKISSDEENKEIDTTSEAKDEAEDIGVPDQMSDLMVRFRESVSGFQVLTLVGTSIMPIVKSRFISEGMYKRISSDHDLLFSDEKFKIFGIGPDQYPLLSRELSRLKEMEQASAALPGAVLLSLVATFDSFLSDTIRILLRHTSERFSSSDKTITISELFSMRNFEDAINKIIDREVDGIMRSSHEDQISYIEKNFNIKIKEFHENWASFMEIFERRNLVAHGKLIINDRYIENCKSHGVDISQYNKGDELKIGPEYLTKSSGLILEFGIILVFVLWKKHFPKNTEDAYKHLSHMVYELIRDGNPRVSARILNFALYKQKPDIKDHVIKMMTVNLANALKKDDKNEDADRIINSVDWSATADEFKICIASIQMDLEEFLDLMSKVAQTGAVSKSHFREWPVFDWVRDEESVRDKFLEIFGEPLSQPKEVETDDATEAADSPSDGGEENPPDGTVH